VITPDTDVYESLAVNGAVVQPEETVSAAVAEKRTPPAAPTP